MSPTECQAERVTIGKIAEFVDQTVCLEGWLYNKRSSGKLHFLQLRDGTGIIQCVMFKGDFPEDVFKAADTLPQESQRPDYRSGAGGMIDRRLGMNCR